jgi:hypothetical protein
VKKHGNKKKKNTFLTTSDVSDIVDLNEPLLEDRSDDIGSVSQQDGWNCGCPFQWLLPATIQLQTNRKY